MDKKLSEHMTNPREEVFTNTLVGSISSTSHEKNRYSDDELENFKQIILKKLEKAKSDLRLLNESYTNGNDDTNDTSPTFKILEEGYQVFSKEENSKFAARQEKFIKSLENALIRIENKTYGICRITGKLIPAERLQRVPHATLSIEAKRVQATLTPCRPRSAMHNPDIE